MELIQQNNASDWKKKLFRNKPGMAGLFIILMTMLIAGFAYYLAPDHSPGADAQTIELSSKKPGFKMKFLFVPDPSIPETGFFERLQNGAQERGKYIPVKQYLITGDSIRIEKYVDEDLGEWCAYPIQTFKDIQQNPEAYIKTRRYYLGTDVLGRDLLSRLIIGSRISLLVGFFAVLISLSIGFFLGAAAGYFGGKTDRFISWLMGVMWSIPTLLLVFAFTLMTGKGMWQIFIAVGLTMWVGTARLIRNQVLSLKEMDFILVGKTMGFRPIRIIFRHLLPNLYGMLIVSAISNFATAIMIEAGLSFLGLGIQPPNPSWGLMMKENYMYLLTNKPMLAIIPGLAIMLLVFSFNMLGNALRDAFDVKS